MGVYFFSRWSQVWPCQPAITPECSPSPAAIFHLSSNAPGGSHPRWRRWHTVQTSQDRRAVTWAGHPSVTWLASHMLNDRLRIPAMLMAFFWANNIEILRWQFLMRCSLAYPDTQMRGCLEMTTTQLTSHRIAAWSSIAETKLTPLSAAFQSVSTSPVLHVQASRRRKCTSSIFLFWNSSLSWSIFC